MKLIIGLGNPGKKYEETRHNAGFLFLDYLAKVNNVSFLPDKSFSIEYAEISLGNNKTILIKPQLFMNKSGDVVAKYMHYYKLHSSEFVIVHDDLDIRLGEFKIARAKGPKVHNGINSIEEKLGTKDFLRVRLGVDNRSPENRVSGESYVLDNFSQQELQTLQNLFENLASQLVDAL